MIGSVARDSAKMNSSVPTMPMAMKPPTGTVGPVAELLVGQADQQEHHRDREDHAADDVEVARRRLRLDRRQQPLDHDQRDDPDRDVDVEDPVPADVLGQEAADERAGHERDAEHGPEQALVLAALLRGEQVADDRERDREQRTGADALDASEQDQHRHVLAEARQGGADQEDHDADHVDRLAAVEVRQLAPERDADRAGEQVDRDGPDVVVVARQLGHDGRQRRTDDGLVERAEEQAEHDREEDLHLRAMTQAEGRVFLERGRRALVLRRKSFHGFRSSLLQGEVGALVQGRAERGSGTDRLARSWSGGGGFVRDFVQAGLCWPPARRAPPRRHAR